MEMDMASRVATRPMEASVEDGLYRRDFYSWTIEQTAALRGGRLSEIDAANLAEEIEDLGRETFKELEGALRIILAHMLKWDHQPNRRSRSWSNSIQTQRLNVGYVLKDNPGLKRRRGEALERAYRKARLQASTEMRRDLSEIPVALPYSLDDILERPFDWPPPDGSGPEGAGSAPA